MVSLTILWYENFGDNQAPLQRNGMALFQKLQKKIKKCFFIFTDCFEVSKKHFSLGELKA